MKIKLKTRLRQLKVVNSVWAYDYLYAHNNNALRAAKSVLELTSSKLLVMEAKRRNDPLDKDFNINLLYHEAYYVEIMCRNVAMVYDAHTYEYNALMNFANQINEKLA